MDIEKIRRIIKFAFIKIGIRCDLVGFNYLCKAVELVILEPDMINHLCKKLYPALCEIFHVNNVERNMRTAIENTYINKQYLELNHLLHTNIFTKYEKPTVGELIRLISEFYNLGFYKEYSDILGLDD